jgi:hypothetical protein
MADPKHDPYFDRDVAGTMEQAWARVQSISFHCPYCNITLTERGNFVWHARHWPTHNPIKCSSCSKQLKIPDYREFFDSDIHSKEVLQARPISTK